MSPVRSDYSKILQCIFDFGVDLEIESMANKQNESLKAKGTFRHKPLDEFKCRSIEIGSIVK